MRNTEEKILSEAKKAAKTHSPTLQEFSSLDFPKTEEGSHENLIRRFTAEHRTPAGYAVPDPNTPLPSYIEEQIRPEIRDYLASQNKDIQKIFNLELKHKLLNLEAQKEYPEPDDAELIEDEETGRYKYGAYSPETLAFYEKYNNELFNINNRAMDTLKYMAPFQNHSFPKYAAEVWPEVYPLDPSIRAELITVMQAQIDNNINAIPNYSEKARIFRTILNNTSANGKIQFTGGIKLDVLARNLDAELIEIHNKHTNKALEITENKKPENAPKTIPLTETITEKLRTQIYENPSIQHYLKQLFESLPLQTQKEIKTLLSKEAKPQTEAYIAAYRLLADNSPKSLFEQFIGYIKHAWNKITNEKALPLETQQTIVSHITQTVLTHSKKITPPELHTGFEMQ